MLGNICVCRAEAAEVKCDGAANSMCLWVSPCGVVRAIVNRAHQEKIKGNESFRAGDYNEAIVYYSRSLSVDDSIVATHNNRALAYIKLSRWTRAIADLDVVLAQEPRNIKALVRKATAFKGANKLGDALAVASRVLELAPNNKDARKLQKDCEGRGNGALRRGSNTAVTPTEVAAPQEGKKRRMIIEEKDPDEEADDNAVGTAVRTEMHSSVDPLEGNLAPKAPVPLQGNFLPCSTFGGARPGFVFQMGTQGLGYYRDSTADDGKNAVHRENADMEKTAGTGISVNASPRGRRIVIEEDSDDDEEDQEEDCDNAKTRSQSNCIALPTGHGSTHGTENIASSTHVRVAVL